MSSETAAVPTASEVSKQLVHALCVQFKSGDLEGVLQEIKTNLVRLRSGSDEDYHKALAMAAVAHLYFDRVSEARECLIESGSQIALIKHIRSRVRAADFRDDLVR